MIGAAGTAPLPVATLPAGTAASPPDAASGTVRSDAAMSGDGTTQNKAAPNAAVSAHTPPQPAPSDGAASATPSDFAELLMDHAAAAPSSPHASPAPPEQATRDSDTLPAGGDLLFAWFGQSWPAPVATPTGTASTTHDMPADGGHGAANAPLHAPAVTAALAVGANTAHTGSASSTATPLAVADVASPARMDAPAVPTNVAAPAVAPVAASAPEAIPAVMLDAAAGLSIDTERLAASSGVEAVSMSAAAGADTPAPTSLPPLGTAPAMATAARAITVPGATLPMPADPGAGFDDGFGARIAWMAEQRLGHAEIRLNPEHLGPVDVRVQLDGSRVHAEFNSANADVRQALEASLPRLRELLGQQGLQLGQTDVGQRQAQGHTGTSRGALHGEGEGDTRASATQAASAFVRSRGLLDEYA